MEFTLRQIGVVRVDATEEEVREKSGALIGRVEVFEAFEDGLHGIDEYSHLFLIAYLDRVRYRLLRVKPRRLLRKGFREEELPELGVFATDSPVRPNPIALTLVRLLRREGRVLHVEGLDLFDGTPVIDIKPYRSDYRAKEYSVPKWVGYDSRPEI
ncbi:MAG: tRNA (N6-threonylcarbamoyladenosine(37)-N6)-methyltransferase TrmO [Thaumarchaeota archaeon]|nr:tRNA (N6-threonylcarbamoyladenosine(37)-N6)-methyltransferase TrmO [Candidatus Calditenuaceae archaeon]MDW8187047.1 tRNA (N6-threonylcarbamoyladenosine(37)-N6)-methyltransferase TrmO [Nitrososphaerota archaeon]